MKGYTVTFRYTASIDVFVAAEEERPIEEIVEVAKNTVDSMSPIAYEEALAKNFRADKFQPFRIQKE